MEFRRFELLRLEDETGISGTGIVARGCSFPNGKIALAWNTQWASVGLYDSMDDLIAIHGHNGKTIVEYLD